MNCFVIMPFAPEFDDVYAAIKSSVESAVPAENRRCFRLDEARPAGRITDRLLDELRSATLCVADLSGTKPNVMWEVGFAMALGKPTVIITQDIASLPFDLKDMQSIGYDRNRLNATLTKPLRQSVLDTLGTLRNAAPSVAAAPSSDSEALGELLSEVTTLKRMLLETVRAWKPELSLASTNESDALQLAGNWVNKESGSHLYSRVIKGSLVTPYCFGGDGELTGIYYGWRRIGEYWFARYRWLSTNLAGFTFLRQENLDRLTGAWWDADQENSGEANPPKHAGVPSTWVRTGQSAPPVWAQNVINEIARDGLSTVLAKADGLPGH
jgi:hypothetical protein